MELPVDQISPVPFLPMDTVRTPKAAELVAASVRRRIVSGELPQGAALPPEAVLVGEFGVSRPTLREAFRILEAERLIQIFRGSRGGARVLAPAGDVAAQQVGLLLQHQRTRLRDVYEASAILESDVVARLAGRRTDADLEQLDAALRQLESVKDDPAGYGAADLAFHAVLARLGGSHTLQLSLELLSMVLSGATQERLRRNPSGERPAMAHALRVYSRLVTLIRSQDVEGARRHWSTHLTAVSRYMAADEATVVEVLA